jgi:Holliday junction resolvase
MVVMNKKEQRVFRNNGKRFEEDFKASFSSHIWTYRPPDSGGGMMARFTHESLCDLMAYNTKTKNFILLELKSTLGTSVSVRPYEQCMEYERIKKEFEDWNATLTPQTRKSLKEEIKEKKKEIKDLYKATNGAMIKYHQIKNLLEVKEKYGIETYIAVTFFRTTNTYAIQVDSFVENFWKITDKKSINENDLERLVEAGQAHKVPQNYIRKTMKSEYDVDFLTE